MKSYLMLMLAAALLFPLSAQDDPLSSEARQAWTRTSNFTVAAANKMPEENYSFKPSPESQSFGDLAQVYCVFFEVLYFPVVYA